MSPPRRGDVWLADLNPVRGHEQAGRRPALVVSDDAFNRGPAGLVIVLPITSTIRAIPSQIRIAPPEGGLKTRSAIICEGIRSISSERLARRWGVVSDRTMVAVKNGCAFSSGSEPPPRMRGSARLGPRSAY